MSPDDQVSAAPDSAARWGRHAIGRARHTEAPLLACLAGLRTPPDQDVGTGLGFSPAPAPQRVGELETAMLADFALGGALRARIARDRPLPTLSLTLDLVADPPPAADVFAEATTTAVGPGLGTGAAILRGPAGPFGHATATFAVPSRGSRPVLPWDAHPGDDSWDAMTLVPTAELDEAEAAALAAATGDAEPGASWCDRLLAAGTTTTTAPGRATLLFRPSVAVANRAGAMQGAVLVALAMRAARVAVAAPSDEEADIRIGLRQVRTCSVSTRFLVAADTAVDLIADAWVEHRTRRTAFVGVSLVQQGRLRAAAGVVCRVVRSGDAHDQGCGADGERLAHRVLVCTARNSTTAALASRRRSRK